MLVVFWWWMIDVRYTLIFAWIPTGGYYIYVDMVDDVHRCACVAICDRADTTPLVGGK